MAAPTVIDHPRLGRFEFDDGLDWWVADDMPVALFGGGKVSVALSLGAGEAPSIDGDMFAALEAMLALGPEAREQITPHVWVNYRQFAEMVGEDDAVRIKPGADIWAHVQPNGVLVERSDDGVYVSLECNCDWEIEHGLMLVLKGGTRWVKVSDYDGHVTDGQAYNKPLLDAWMKDPDAVLPIRTSEEIRATPKGPKP